MKSTETSHRLIASMEAMRKLDTEKLFASGINVTVTNYTTGGDTIEETTIPGEFFEPVRVALYDALKASLLRRRETVQWELRDINKFLGIVESE